jgi:hypothetical protein
LKNSSYAISNLIAAKGVPFLINNCPLEIIRVGNVVAKTLSGFERAPLNSLCFSLSTYHLAKHLNIRYISTVAKIISSIILSRVIYSTFPGYLTYAINSGFSINSFDLSLSSINFFSRISEQFTMIGMKNENHMRNELKNHLRTVWINAMISQIPQNQPLNIIEPALQ